MFKKKAVKEVVLPPVPRFSLGQVVWYIKDRQAEEVCIAGVYLNGNNVPQYTYRTGNFSNVPDHYYWFNETVFHATKLELLASL